MIAPRPTAWLACLALAGLGLAAREAAAAEPLLVDFHFKPVPNLQIAIWLEDKDGAFVQDVFVTQATGKYGIGNRPGRWDFVSSWREPYGPRPSALPVWANRRGKTYPKIVFFDDDKNDQNSLGWHENSSSDESYFCRPLTDAENEKISVDTKTCPSPQVFNSDKGRFDPGGATSPYPPRNDLVVFDPNLDSQDARDYSGLNDLDAVTAATPLGDQAEVVTALLAPELLARGPLTAYIEVSLEHDENGSYDYDREKDHFVDPRLANYGVEYLGQPSVVYRVDFDPGTAGFHGTREFAGYGDWNGVTGTLHPPDTTISTDGGSGADRLAQVTINGQTFRWGVYAYGPDGADTDGGGWGDCKVQSLPPVTDLTLSGMSFDRVQVDFTLPEVAADIAQVHVYSISGVSALTEDLLSAAHVQTFSAAELAAATGPVSVEVDELWGDYTYQFGVVYEDRCTNRSELVTAAVTTAPQKFQQVDSFCFVATAAYGAPWAAPVQALRDFRDTFLKQSATGLDLVRFYYAFSPPLARVIAREPLLRGMARVVLQPVADAARMATPG